MKLDFQYNCKGSLAIKLPNNCKIVFFNQGDVFDIGFCASYKSDNHHYMSGITGDLTELLLDISNGEFLDFTVSCDEFYGDLSEVAVDPNEVVLTIVEVNKIFRESWNCFKDY